eukprot:362958-Chlamydomonas_euryale.AAC.1
MPYGHACCCTAAVMAPYDAPKLWHCIAICLEGCGLACMELAGECADPNLTSLCRPLLGFRKAKRSAETVADVDNARHGRHAAVAGVVPHVPGVLDPHLSRTAPRHSFAITSLPPAPEIPHAPAFKDLHIPHARSRQPSIVRSTARRSQTPTQPRARPRVQSVRARPDRLAKRLTASQRSLVVHRTRRKDTQNRQGAATAKAVVAAKAARQRPKYAWRARPVILTPPGMPSATTTIGPAHRERAMAKFVCTVLAAVAGCFALRWSAVDRRRRAAAPPSRPAPASTSAATGTVNHPLGELHTRAGTDSSPPHAGINTGKAAPARSEPAVVPAKVCITPAADDPQSESADAANAANDVLHADSRGSDHTMAPDMCTSKTDVMLGSDPEDDVAGWRRDQCDAATAAQTATFRRRTYAEVVRGIKATHIAASGTMPPRMHKYVDAVRGCKATLIQVHHT